MCLTVGNLLTGRDTQRESHIAAVSDPAHATPEEKGAAADGTFAYCGRYEIDAKQKQIIHIPEVATDPGYVGSRQVRPYAFEGERLVLSDVVKDDPSIVRWKIVWEKVK